MQWLEQDDLEKINKSSTEAKYEYIVKVDRYKHLLQAFNLFKNHRAVIPVDAYERTCKSSTRAASLYPPRWPPN